MKIQDISRVLLGGLLLVASLVKVCQPEQFARVVESYGVVPEPWVLHVSMGLPFVEMILGILLLFGAFRLVALCVAALFSLGALGILAWAVSQGMVVDCLCFRGLGLKPPFDGLHILQHGALATLALVLLLREFKVRQGNTSANAPPQARLAH